MSRLEDYRGVHHGRTIVVCGCGESLNLLEHPERFVTIGVNDVGRSFTPDYLVVVNAASQFRGDRFRWVVESRAKALFTQMDDLGVPHPNVVRFRLGTYGGVDVTQPNVLPYTQNSPYIALCLAAVMGAGRIGVLGVDFTEHHFFAATGRHPLADQLARIDAEFTALARALAARGIEVVNLSPVSKLTALPRLDLDALTPAAAGTDPGQPLDIVSYATTPIAGVPLALAECIRDRTPHGAECVWATGDYGNGVRFSGGLEWNRDAEAAASRLRRADVVIVHNGKADPAHVPLLDGKPVVTMAHNYGWNVDAGFVERGLPGLVVGQYQATLPEFAGWPLVPNPIPLWEPQYAAVAKPDVVTICYTPSGPHERYPEGHPLFWHAKGYDTTMLVLDGLARRHGIAVRSVRDGRVSHAESLAMKRGSHITIDECVTGSYHRNSLEGLACGCVVVNGVGLLPGVAESLRRCAPEAAALPFVQSDLAGLERTLSELIEQGPATLAERGRQGRDWMERHWEFGRQWSDCWMPAIDRARAQVNGTPRAVPVNRATAGSRLLTHVDPSATRRRNEMALSFASAARGNLRRGRESSSGPGSSLEQTAELRRRLPSLLAELGARRLLDAGCGDFHWLQSVRLDLDAYVGVEIVQEIAHRNRRKYGRTAREFLAADLASDRLPEADLVLCRDVLVLLSFEDGLRLLRNLRRSGSRLLLATTFPDREANADVETGGWRPLNLAVAPYDLGPPLRILNEGCTEADGRFSDKSLGLWSLSPP